MQRRNFIIGTLGIVAAGVLLRTKSSVAESPEVSKTLPAIADDEWQHLTPEVWRQRLTKPQFYVLREAGTERPHSSQLNKEKRDGTYVCAGCELPLFKSNMKYDSGTGWPSFFTAIEDSVGTSTDYKLLYPRTEYHCSRCGGHQGHVFKDGPQPTGQRWCNNGVALKFIPA